LGIFQKSERSITDLPKNDPIFFCYLFIILGQNPGDYPRVPIRLLSGKDILGLARMECFVYLFCKELAIGSLPVLENKIPVTRLNIIP
jgi:hypothetical protein